jgi:hypothetical protein
VSGNARTVRWFGVASQVIFRTETTSYVETQERTRGGKDVRQVLFGIVLVAGACARQASVVPTPQVAATPAIIDGKGVVSAMRDRYKGRWFSTLSFAQNAVLTTASGESKLIWYEYIAVPGRLRIDYAPLETYSGVLYADGKLHSFGNNGRAAEPLPGWNPLLVLIGDVYVQSPDTTAWQLDSLGFDLAVVRRERWRYDDLWVVGAERGDSLSSQFWVDTDSLLVRRVVLREVRGGRTFVTDIHLAQYRDVGGFPVAHEITFYRDGKLYLKEDYFDVKTNVVIDDAVFDPAKWKEAQVKR